tara:strand:+ start:118 stop:1071 length:954 start_codon:yes stop_codon:yes gene_type:complete
MNKWLKYLDEARRSRPIRNNRQVSNEPYQQAVKKGYVKDRNKYLKGGPVSTSAGGSGYTQKPANSRSLNAPPIGEDVEPESFEKNSTLEPVIWSENKINEQVRNKMLKIAEDFMEGLDISAKVEDIRLTGSLANYNWSKYSDVDLHIVVDFSLLDDDLELVKAYFDEARMRWNDNHSIKIEGYDVEIYVEDKLEKHESSGIYSVLNNEWVVTPDPSSVSIDFDTARKKSNSIATKINLVSHIVDNKSYDAALRAIDTIKKEIRRLRRAGLHSPAREFSAENIAFKILRREESLKKLNDLKKLAYDKMMSIEPNESDI